MQSSTSQHHGFAGNVVEEKNLNYAVANFGQSSAAYRSSFTKLTDTNAYLQQHVANISPKNDELQQKRSALQNQMNMMNLDQNPAISPGQTQCPHTIEKPPKYPQYPQLPTQGYQTPPRYHALTPQISYRKTYDQRGEYRGQGRGQYLPRGASQGQYQ